MIKNRYSIIVLILVTASLLAACNSLLGSSSVAPDPIDEVAPAEAQQEAPAQEPAVEPAEETAAEVVEPEAAEAEAVAESVEETASDPEAEAVEESAAETGAGGQAANYPAWASVPITDVRTGETFTLDSFEGQIVIMEMMAVWCPFCDQQQVQIKGAIEQLGDGVVGVSLDVDPGETPDIVIAHANELGLPWHFALAGPELSNMLREAYGPEVLTPPATPVIIIGPDGTAQLTPSGIKNSDQLVELANQLRS